jgi:phosphoribosyl-ATP pyrophosphohydrolase
VDTVLQSLFETIEDRRRNLPAGSYTATLFQAGETEILKKIGEEAVEVIVAASREGDERITYEMADLIYHCQVLLSARGLEWADVEAELARRAR